MRLEDRLKFRQLIDEMRGDPQLSAWEEGVLLGLTRQRELTEKQVGVLLRIRTSCWNPQRWTARTPNGSTCYPQQLAIYSATSGTTGSGAVIACAGSSPIISLMAARSGATRHRVAYSDSVTRSPLATASASAQAAVS